MTYRVTILPLAHHDAEQIFAYLAKRSLTGAARWYSAFWAVARSLCEDPLRHTKAQEARQRRTDLFQCFFKTPRGRTYRLIYVVDDSDVRILRVRGPGQSPVRKLS